MYVIPQSLGGQYGWDMQAIEIAKRREYARQDARQDAESEKKAEDKEKKIQKRLTSKSTKGILTLWQITRQLLHRQAAELGSVVY